MVADSVVASSFLALVLLAIYHAVPRGRWRGLGGRGVRLRVLVRALLPGRLLRSRSGRADIGFMLFSLFLAGTTIGWALFSSRMFEHAVSAALLRHMPAPAPSDWPALLRAVIATAALFLAYEFAYWVNHWLSHRVAWLWEFHKVHHTAETLSMLTNFRVHPVDTIIFYNMVAACTGTVAGLLDIAFGRPTDALVAGGTNLLIFVSATVLTNLQHSHLWISLPGRWGRILLSPAHHQIHHSREPRHHGRNFGATLAVFDRLFGTLHMPSKVREKLSLGVDGLDHDPHGLSGALVQPFIGAAKMLWPRRASVTLGARPKEA